MVNQKYLAEESIGKLLLKYFASEIIGMMVIQKWHHSL